MDAVAAGVAAVADWLVVADWPAVADVAEAGLAVDWLDELDALDGAALVAPVVAVVALVAEVDAAAAVEVLAVLVTAIHPVKATTPTELAIPVIARARRAGCGRRRRGGPEEVGCIPGMFRSIPATPL